MQNECAKPNIRLLLQIPWFGCSAFPLSLYFYSFENKKVIFPRLPILRGFIAHIKYGLLPPSGL